MKKKISPKEYYKLKSILAEYEKLIKWIAKEFPKSQMYDMELVKICKDFLDLNKEERVKNGKNTTA